MLLWSDNEPKEHTFKTKKAPTELTEEAGRQNYRVSRATVTESETLTGFL